MKTFAECLLTEKIADYKSASNQSPDPKVWRHFDHLNGSWVKMSSTGAFHAIHHNQKTGKQTTFDSLDGLHGHLSSLKEGFSQHHERRDDNGLSARSVARATAKKFARKEFRPHTVWHHRGKGYQVLPHSAPQVEKRGLKRVVTVHPFGQEKWHDFDAPERPKPRVTA